MPDKANWHTAPQNIHFSKHQKHKYFRASKIPNFRASKNPENRLIQFPGVFYKKLLQQVAADIILLQFGLASSTYFLLSAALTAPRSCCICSSFIIPNAPRDLSGMNLIIAIIISS